MEFSNLCIFWELLHHKGSLWHIFLHRFNFVQRNSNPIRSVIWKTAPPLMQRRKWNWNPSEFQQIFAFPPFQRAVSSCPRTSADQVSGTFQQRQLRLTPLNLPQETVTAMEECPIPSVAISTRFLDQRHCPSIVIQTCMEDLYPSVFIKTSQL